MPAFRIVTAHAQYECIVERGILASLRRYMPQGSGKTFIVTNQQVWNLHGSRIGVDAPVLMLPDGESAKRFEHVETLAEQMVDAGADRTSVVVALGGGIVNDMAGFLAAIFMRGIRVVQIPTTLLAQVDAAIGGKTGVNLRSGKNLIGAFHQPSAVLIDPDLLTTLPEREYRAGLYEVIKYGVIQSPKLFETLENRRADVLQQAPEVVDGIVAESVRIKCEVVSADEREGDFRRILNFGHTVGHALEAETQYSRFLHGEAVAFGMKAATHLAARLRLLTTEDCDRILRTVAAYGPVPSLDGITPDHLLARLVSDKKTIQGKVHFVLPDRIGHTVIRSGVPDLDVLAAIRAALDS